MSGNRLGFGLKLALGAGDFGFNLYWQFASLYLLFFYTDVVGLRPEIAGAIYMAALIWDAALDPLIGAVVDRTRTRYGRYRPYFMFGGIPLALSFIAMFVGPTAGEAGAALFATVVHFLFRTVYAIVAIPYAALFARVTNDARVRADLAGFRMIFATLAAVVVAALTLPLVRGLATTEEPNRGWLLIAIAFGLVAVVLMLLVAWAARGLDVDEPAKEAPVGARTLVAALLSNKALLVVLGAVMIGQFCSTLFGKNLLYYFKYAFGREDLGGTALALTALTMVFFVPLFAWIARRWGKRNAWIIGAVPSLIGLVMWHLVDGASLELHFLALFLIGIGSAAYAVCFWAMLPDTVEYGEWRSGVRTESLVFGLGVLGQKVSLGLGAGLLGVALNHVGYVANVEQSPETINGIKQMMFWIPLIGGLCSLALICRYPISLALHAQIVDELAARREKKGG
ncbi:MFS transporter [Solimonas sp. K1W22B-7]|uniref:MFS transporter n=1 Tax=Solimonas sp. K1W22B-7 TaxID=2303331 RepID=UPI000E331486|nr:glycoside-pentoside-hexuronide (GPH):cation symporter [Solimonas sp. K1W22B-7]AXQ31276.1 MFS transporter [Solimonas sp. K1W22B-7]